MLSFLKNSFFVSLFISSAFLFSACSSPKAQKGDIVSITYTARFEDETPYIFTGTQQTLTLGSGQTLPGLDEGIIGMHAGQTKVLHITPDKGYSYQYDKNKRQKVAKIVFTKMGAEIRSGQAFSLGSERGIIRGTEINSAGNEIVIFDTNPPHTQLPLLFTVTLHSIK